MTLICALDVPNPIIISKPIEGICSFYYISKSMETSLNMICNLKLNSAL
jgi:hypothetical protein